MTTTEFLAGLPTYWRNQMLGDTIRYIIFSIGFWLIMWLALARPLRNRQIREQRAPGSQMRREFFYSLRSIMVFSTLMLLPSTAFHFGWWNGPKMARDWSMGWYIASFVLIVVAHDAYFYWAHRASHHPRLFRWVHRQHHRSHNPSPFTAYSFDLWEAVLMGSFVPIWVLLVPTPWDVVDLFALHQIVRNTLLHCGIEVMPARRNGRPLFDWLTTTTHHDLHHARAGWNFGLYFTWWDRWMGTEHPEYHRHFAAAVGRTPTKADAEPVLG